MPSNRCPICRTRKSVRLTTKEGRDILICERCRHIYWNVLPTQAELKHFYTDAYTDTHEQREIQEKSREYFRSHIAEMRVEAGEGEADRELFLLDFGSSYPVLVQEAIKSGMNGLAVDWSADAKSWADANSVPMITPDQLARLPN